jgi:hypothetical protein
MEIRRQYCAEGRKMLRLKNFKNNPLSRSANEFVRSIKNIGAEHCGRLKIKTEQYDFNAKLLQIK